VTIHTATVRWERGEQAFTDGRYSRGHLIAFDGGVSIPGSSAPSSVRVPFSVEAAADPEELTVAALSSCHMLFFLAFAKKAEFRVDSYEDAPEGVLARGEDGKDWLTHITLRPQVVFSGDAVPDAAAIDALHHEAHEACYIANSLRSVVTVEPR
jgi:organic hydroperoxide reductase OsmC/OhrA